MHESDIIGIIGGTGLEKFPEIRNATAIPMRTPYGDPSADPIVGTLDGKCIVFIPRHGIDHVYAPHLIPYKANLYALKQLGAKMVIATCVAGSLKKDIRPGSFVIPDQFINFTWGRDADCVEEDGSFVHLSVADPYCATIRSEMYESLKLQQLDVKQDGTVVVIQGPRFNTKAESRFQIKNDWDIVNMTQYPECLYARELGLCYASMASITDWDIGLGNTLSMSPDTMDEVLEIFRRNTIETLKAVNDIQKRLRGKTCSCAQRMITEYYRRS